MNGSIALLLSHSTYKPCQTPGTNGSGCEAAPSPAESQEGTPRSSHLTPVVRSEGRIGRRESEQPGVMRGEQTTQPRGWGATHVMQEPARTQMCVLYTHTRVHGVAHIGIHPGIIACLLRVCAHSPHKRLPRPPTHICGCTRPCTSLPMCDTLQRTSSH